MKEKILFGVITAILVFSMFAGLKLATSQVANSMALNPEELIVDPPPYGAEGWFFLYPINISTTYNVYAWEAILLWNPDVLRLSLETPVVWGNFMTGAPVHNEVKRLGESGVQLSQNFETDYNVTGEGVLVSLNFTFVLPGATAVEFLESIILDPDLTAIELTAFDGRVKSNLPRPLFTWSTADGRNPLPQHSIYDGGDTIVHGDVVTFNASLSYDVCNLYWDGIAYVPDANYPDIVYYRWEFGDGTFEEGADKAVVTHTYTSYKKEGWLVNLTVWDSEGEYWSSTWRYGGPASGNTVPMWRDVAVVDIWPSLPPYEMWDEYGEDWYAWWWFDTTDYWIPYVEDPYWDYHLPDSYCDDFGLPHGTTVRQAYYDYDGSAGLWILVTAANYGSVSEKVTINLYAIRMSQKLGFTPNPVGEPFWNPKLEQEVIKIASWTKTIDAGKGTGWGCLAIWLPPKNGFYTFFATVESASNSVTDDKDKTNNYFLMPATFTNIAKWRSSDLTLQKEGTYARYIMDVTGDNLVGSTEFAILGNKYIYNKRWNVYTP